jgi:NADH-quinone oxidoreductase subunit J
VIDIAYSTLVFVVGVTAALAAIGVILCSSPVYSALFLIGNMICLAILFLLYNAEFIAIVQIIVYAGAVMILFLFIIALLGAKKEDPAPSIEKGVALAFIPVLFGELLLALTVDTTNPLTGAYSVESVKTLGSAKAIGLELFSKHLIPFELASVLLLVATAGIICLAKFQSRPLRRRAR